MAKYCLLVLLLLAVGARAQDGFVTENRSLTMDVFDHDGKAFVNHSPDVAGSPFLSEGWRLGSLILTNKQRFDSVKLRLDLLTQQVHVLDRNGIEMELARGYVREFRLSPNTPAQSRFVIGFPSVDLQDAGSFYEVRSAGSLWLLRSLRKIIARKTNDMSGEISREYQFYEDWYVYDGKTMQRVKKDKAWLLELMTAKKDSVETFINSNKLKIKSYDEIQRTIDFYNSL